MTRLILFLFAAVVVLAVVRAVIRVVLRGVADLFDDGTPQPPKRPFGGRAPTLPKSDELKKDPVCGTFIAASTAVQKTVKGETYYFCSTACRDKFQG